MNRREVIGATAALGAGMVFPHALAIAGAASSVYDRLLDSTLTASPQMATTYGLDTASRAGLKHRLDDRGPANRLNMYQSFRDQAAELAAMSMPADPRGRQWLETARWFAGATHDMAALPHLTVSSVTYPHPYAVTQLTGASVDVPDLLATQHSIRDRGDCEAYLDRLAAFSRVIDQDIATSRAQAVAGIVPPDFICERATSQLDDLINDRGDRSGLVQGLATAAGTARVAGDWQRRATALVDGPVHAALVRQRAHLTELRSAASAAAGIGSRPDGSAFYGMALRFHLTTDTSPAEVHRIGLDEVAAMQAEAGALMDRLGYPAGATVARLNALAKDPEQLFPNTDAGREALLAYARERTTDVERRLSAAFAHLPRMPMEVRRVPVATELGAPFAYSVAGGGDGTRPGAIYFNLSTMADWPRWQVPSTTYHEGLPGHHLQESLASETPGIPRVLRMLMPVAYNEGWGLYAEQLADELGVYDEEPLGRLGRLQLSLFRACRMVVDTGIHAQGWTRERAIAFLINEGGVAQAMARREVERYCVWPGQACAYKMGYREIMRQRQAAKTRLGQRFSLPAFHDVVLMGGAMPLSVMDRLLTTTLV